MKSARAAAVVAAAERVVSYSDFLPSSHGLVSFTVRPEVIDPFFKLTKQNMKLLYDSAGDPDWEWTDSKKRVEISSAKNRFIQLHSRETGELIAFASFRFLIDRLRPVVYVYELQVDARFRSRGIGHYLTSQIETLARVKSPGLVCVVLTCLGNNTPALAFYRKLGYKPDMSNPGNKKYTILSKQLN